MNKVILDGNLVRDIDVKDTGKILIGNFTIANNRGYGEDKRTTFIRCSIFGNRVEKLANYLLKGAKVLVCGELEITSEETEEGYKNYTNVLVDDLDIIRFVNEEEEEKEEPNTRKGTGESSKPKSKYDKGKKYKR